MGPTFFGLTPEYRNIIFTQIHDLVYHGGGGFIHSEVYNMPVWLRRYHIQKLNEYFKKQSEENSRQSEKPKSNITGPNVTPSSVYNFKK